MDESTRRRILEKAEYVAEAVSILADKRDELSLDDYSNRREQRDVVEREFQTAIEACIDVARMILRAEDGEVPDTNAEVFRRLADEHVIDGDVAERMSEAAGFRNVLAHNYGDAVDDEDVYNVLQHELDAFPEFLEDVRAFLETSDDG